MQEYILINRVASSYGQVEAKEVMEAWENITDQWKRSEIFVTSFVFPLEGITVSGKSSNVTIGNILTDNLKIVSVIIIKATNLENAVAMANYSPILQQQGPLRLGKS